MANKKKPWDDVIGFDDWNKEIKEDEEIVEEPESTYINDSTPQEIQGLGITDTDEDVIDLGDLIAGVNADNATYTAKAIEEETERRNKKLAEAENEERKRKEEKLRAKFEAESAEREKIAFEEAEAAAAAEREKQEKSIKNIASKFFKIKPKNKSEKTEDKKDVNQNIEKEQIQQENSNESEIEDSLVKEDVLLTDSTEDNTADLDNIPIDTDLLEPNAQIQYGQDEDIDIQTAEDITDVADIDEISNVAEFSKFSNIESGEKKEKTLENRKKTLFGFGEKDKLQKKEETLQADIEESQVPNPIVNKNKSQDKLFSFPLFKKKKENQSAEIENVISDVQGNGNTDWEFLATHDELTGLLNQRAFEEQKKNERKKPYAVIYVDVNNLKYANDTYGHAAGNKLIIATAEMMKKLFPDCSYRIGGDEFVAIAEYTSVKKIEKDIIQKRDQFNEAMLKKTKEDKDSGLIYAASFGYAFTDGSKSFEEVSSEADEAMYKTKEAYKKANPHLDMRSGRRTAEKKKTDPPKDYDSMLTKEQRGLKKTIQDNHRPVSVTSTQQIIRDVQSKASQVIAILIASPTFDQLFIILRPEVFINIIMEMESMIDYSYLYILYEGGPQYKGSDEYLSEVTHIFEAIGNGIKSGKIRSESDILKIKGINVFKNIYVDF